MERGGKRCGVTNLLISGSRDDNSVMRKYARRCVQRAKDRVYLVIIGDAHGIDAVVMEECHRLGVPHIVYGANGTIRRRTPSCSIYICDGNYLARDYEMAKACDLCIGIWNNKKKSNGGKSGTEHTYGYAVELGKQAWLAACIEGEMRIIQRSNIS